MTFRRAEQKNDTSTLGAERCHLALHEDAGPGLSRAPQAPIPKLDVILEPVEIAEHEINDYPPENIPIGRDEDVDGAEDDEGGSQDNSQEIS
ncbi:hypothetical protein TKK_0019123 [Trichogramma kaykai]